MPLQDGQLRQGASPRRGIAFFDRAIRADGSSDEPSGPVEITPARYTIRPTVLAGT